MLLLRHFPGVQRFPLFSIDRPYCRVQGGRHFRETRATAVTLASSETCRLDDVYPSGYIVPMNEIRKTAEFAHWIDNLRDIQARARVLFELRDLRQDLPVT